MSNEKKRNYEWRGVPGFPRIQVTRDGEIRYQKGKERYTRDGALIRPEFGWRNPDGSAMSIQMMIHKAFPDIPMRWVPNQ